MGQTIFEDRAVVCVCVHLSVCICAHIYVNACICMCVCALHTCMRMHELVCLQKLEENIRCLPYHFLPYFRGTGSLTEPQAGLVASKSL